MNNQPGDRVPLSGTHLFTFLFSRTVSNLSYRIIYPFLPVLARGLGVSIEGAGQLAAAQGGAGMVAPLFGPLSDRYGRRRVMVLGLLVLALASAITLLTDQFYLVLFAFAGFGLAKGLYDPAMQAYIGDLVPYAQRGRIIAITELAWSFAWVFGVPLAGFLIERGRWNAPWLFVAVMALVAALLTHRLLPATDGRSHAASRRNPWLDILRQPTVWGALLISTGLLFALENVLIVYGVFLEERFGLSTSAIGIVSIAIGVAELLAEGGSVFLTDRFGKATSVFWGLVLFALSLVLLVPLSATLWGALLAFSAAVLFFEYALVSLLPLLTELAPANRGTLMSLNIAAMGTGRVLAPLVGTALYVRSDSMLPNILISTLCCLLCAALAWRILRGL